MDDLPARSPALSATTPIQQPKQTWNFNENKSANLGQDELYLKMSDTIYRTAPYLPCEMPRIRFTSLTLFPFPPPNPMYAGCFYPI